MTQAVEGYTTPVCWQGLQDVVIAIRSGKSRLMRVTSILRPHIGQFLTRLSVLHTTGGALTSTLK